MSTEDPGKRISLPAYSDLTGYQYRFVKLYANQNRVTYAGDGEVAIGVLQNKPAAIDRIGSVMVEGVTQLIAGAAVAASYLLAADAQGRAIQAANGKHIRAIALEDAAAAGVRFQALLLTVGKYA